MIDPKIVQYAKDHRRQHLDRLKDFLRFPSISAQAGHAEDCGACAKWLAEQFRALGLESRVDSSTGQPVVLAQSTPRPDKPTLLVYGHYDVQPPEPLDLWTSPPFEPTERDGNLYARGACDDKGQLLTWLLAAECYKAIGLDWPVNLKFIIEGEEELGSPTLEPFLAGHAAELACDHVAISDTDWFDERTPSITYGLRGLVYVEVTLTGPAMDLHSGLYGGVVCNPIHALSALVAGLVDKHGKVTIPGFYDKVQSLPPSEHVAWEKLGLTEEQLMAELGVSALCGEEGYLPIERLWARPTVDCNGIWGGYIGQGPKTVIPSWAKAKISCRLVPDQTPEEVLARLEEYFARNCPPGTSVEMKTFTSGHPWMVPPNSPALRAACSAMEEAFDKGCKLIRGGGSVPITYLFRHHLGVDALMMGYGLPDDRVHSPNEKFKLEHFFGGILASAALMQNLG